jgi:hypothetical protein
MGHDENKGEKATAVYSQFTGTECNKCNLMNNFLLYGINCGLFGQTAFLIIKFIQSVNL